MNDEMNFKCQEARNVPVILMLDTSGSMSANGNIDVLNAAVKEMLDDFAKQSDNNVSIKVAIYTFGPDVKEYLPLSTADEAKAKFQPMDANGGTPLGGALSMAKTNLIENKELITSRGYRPMVVLVSDGMPNDNWEPVFEEFCESGRSSKCFRMAMGIGAQKETPAHAMLSRFVSDPKFVFSAEDATTIKKFFKFVTISTIKRSTSATPNNMVVSTIEEVDDIDDLSF